MQQRAGGTGSPSIGPGRLPPTTWRAREGHLRLLSYNIQVGLSTERYRHYITRSWRHVLPSAESLPNLDRIARLISHYDIVALQEIDAGSLRSRNINQMRYLAERAGFPYWNAQVNRDLGRIAQHSLGFLSRFPPDRVQEHKLPGMIPGRGVLMAHFGGRDNPLVLVVTHLSLGPRTRRQQLGFIGGLVRNYEHVILMGDTNCEPEYLVEEGALRDTGLQAPLQVLNTYPSWQPRRNIDHILVTPSLRVHRCQVINEQISDHLPVAMEVVLPEGLDLSAREQPRE